MYTNLAPGFWLQYIPCVGDDIIGEQMVRHFECLIFINMATIHVYSLSWFIVNCTVAIDTWV